MPSSAFNIVTIELLTGKLDRVWIVCEDFLKKCTSFMYEMTGASSIQRRSHWIWNFESQYFWKEIWYDMPNEAKGSGYGKNKTIPWDLAIEIDATTKTGSSIKWLQLKDTPMPLGCALRRLLDARHGLWSRLKGIGGGINKGVCRLDECDEIYRENW